MATKTVSIVTGGNNNATVTASEINAIATDFIADGVVGAIGLNTGSGGTGSFAVNAQGTPGMSVRVSAGQLYCAATPSGGTSQRVRVSMDTYEDVTISANSTGGTRYDHLYAVISASALANPGANKDDVVTLTTSRSTSSSTDNGTPPTYGYKLAVITVVNGATSITNSNITDSRVQTAGAVSSASIGSTQVVTGVPVQVVGTNYSAVNTGTTTIPIDDTIPQNTEGTEFMSQAITPKSATNRLSIEAVLHLASNQISTWLQAALFQDSTANALASNFTWQATANGVNILTIRHDMVAGTTSSTTFKVRGGADTAGTVTFNGFAGNRKHGGITLSSIRIIEYKAS